MTGSRLDIDMQVLKYLIYFHLFLINNLTSKRESELGYIASADFAFIRIERRNHLAMVRLSAAVKLRVADFSSVNCSKNRTLMHENRLFIARGNDTRVHKATMARL